VADWIDSLSRTTMQCNIQQQTETKITTSISVCFCCQLFAVLYLCLYYCTVVTTSTTYSCLAPTLRCTTNVLLLSSHSLPLIVFYPNSCIYTSFRGIEITTAVCWLRLEYATNTVEPLLAIPTCHTTLI
jgi:hypothetical protein